MNRPFISWVFQFALQSFFIIYLLSTQRHVHQKCFICDRKEIINGTQTFGQKSYKLRRKSILEHLKSVHAVMARHDPYTPQIPHPNPKLWSLHGRSWAIRVFVGEKLLLILTTKYYIFFIHLNLRYLKLSNNAHNILLEIIQYYKKVYVLL